MEEEDRVFNSTDSNISVNCSYLGWQGLITNENTYSSLNRCFQQTLSK